MSMTGNRWIVEHQDHWPVYGRTREEAEAEAIAQWFDGEFGELVTALRWGICTVRLDRPRPPVAPLIDTILDIVRPPKE